MTGRLSQESRFNNSVINGLFYLASDGGLDLLPSLESYLITAVVAGVHEYITGQEFQDGHTECLGFMRDPWIRKINKSLEVLDGQNKFNPALAGAIKYWTHISWCHDHGESWWESQIRYWLMFGDQNRMQSTFALTVPRAREIEEALQSLDRDTLHHIRSIAETMKKYIKRDIEYIRQYYYW